MLNKTITFVARDKWGFDTQLKPYPAATGIPEWWKAENPYEPVEKSPDAKKLIVDHNMVNFSFKKCTPMLDAITSGYIIPLWTDVQIRWEDDGIPAVNWRTFQNPFDGNTGVLQKHGPSSARVGAPSGYTNYVFKYMNTWIPKTPPGYSVLIQQPVGYGDLPLRAIPAVIDSDKSELEVVAPMWLQEGFEGILKKGTPLMQVIPFKREDWQAEFAYYEGQDYMKTQERNFNSNLISNYIKRHWSKKTYK